MADDNCTLDDTDADADAVADDVVDDAEGDSDCCSCCCCICCCSVACLLSACFASTLILRCSLSLLRKYSNKETKKKKNISKNEPTSK